MQDGPALTQLLVDLAVAASQRTPVAQNLTLHPGAPTIVEPRTNLPAQLTSFVGREREVAEVERLLGTTRLFTLTGSRGSGKTRLALEVATRLMDADAFADGVWLIEFVPLSDPHLGAGAQDALGQRGAGVDQVLAVVEHQQHVVETFAPDTADESLDDGIRPGRPVGCPQYVYARRLCHHGQARSLGLSVEEASC